MGSETQTSEFEEKAKEWGIDVSLIDANLRRTYTERLEVLQQALDTIDELRRAWDNEQHQRHPSTAPRKPD